MLHAATRLRRAIGALSSLMGLVAGWGFVLCAFFIAFEVLARSLFRFSTQSTTEITGYMLAFGLSWGLGHALNTRSHVRIDMLVNRLPQKLRIWLHLLSLLLLGILMAFVAKGAWDLVDESLLFGATDISLLRTPLAIPQGLWAFGMIVFLLLIAAMLVENLLLAIAGEAGQLERNLSSRGYVEEAQEALDALAEAEARR
ncbi:TRAP transporter small permease subunit [Falsiroseomonas tokyonensis]|uniref:TRAP transporter small permease protein n=1 Tax=Falsiroseomonas tokyonensis TaxID=430521 RepID=A0ABV7BZH2_9PROT|nr:TRAP transporter small permease [Falsiroseomonas tokyonensis]MBU8539597.1 TRAP transporter small permease [Falsiroseomonas tokyonensis]